MARGHRPIGLWVLWSLLIAIVVLWVCGYFRRFDVRYSQRSWDCGISFFNGGIFFDYSWASTAELAFPVESGVAISCQPVTDPSFVIRWSHAGFFAFTAETYPGRQGTSSFAEAGVPYWFLVALCLIAIAWGHFRRRRQRLAKAHQFCVKCGYDLRASSERCPECGTEVGGVRRDG
jgi:hypothetical protein